MWLAKYKTQEGLPASQHPLVTWGQEPFRGPFRSNGRCVLSKGVKIIYPLPSVQHDLISRPTGRACACLSKGIFTKKHSGWNPSSTDANGKNSQAF